MKETLLRNARYNAWANNQFVGLMKSIDDAVLDKEIVSSFPSIRKTVYHMWGAEDIWLQRLNRAENPVWRPQQFEGSFAEACAAWTTASEGFVRFADAIHSDNDLFKKILVVNMKGEHYEDAVGEILQHVTNHAAYHRGQLVTMLRQAGITSLPQTDLIAFTRKGETVFPFV